MFTGLITAIGMIVEVHREGDVRLQIASPYPAGDLTIGESISCSGACLTVVEVPDARCQMPERGKIPGNRQPAIGNYFSVSLSTETLSRTVPGMWEVGKTLNLERALALSDRLGGHLVTGHIDGVARLVDAAQEGTSTVWTLEVLSECARLIAAKGSVALDGVSLTVNAVNENRFTVNLIPHTLEATTLGEKNPGDSLNLEVDLIARYVARLITARE